MAALDATWRWPGAIGVAATCGDELVGFMIGMCSEPRASIRSGYVPADAYAVAHDDTAELLPRLYAPLDTAWRADRRYDHHVYLDAPDTAAYAAWKSLGFEDFLTLAAAPLVPPSAPPVAGVRQATIADRDAVIALLAALERHHTAPPIALPARGDTDHLADATTRLHDPRTGCWLAFDRDTAVGLITIRPPDHSIAGRYCPPAAIHLVELITVPSARGRGLGRALCDAALGWAQLLGYRHAVLHVHAANTVGRRFWDALGFRAVAHHLVRHVAPDADYRRGRGGGGEPPPP